MANVEPSSPAARLKDKIFFCKKHGEIRYDKLECPVCFVEEKHLLEKLIRCDERRLFRPRLEKLQVKLKSQMILKSTHFVGIEKCLCDKCHEARIYNDGVKAVMEEISEVRRELEEKR